MAITLANGKIRLLIDTLLNSGLDLSTAQDRVRKSSDQAVSNGTGANQANMVFSDQRTVASASNEDLDLAASLVNAFGATITFTAIKAIILIASAQNTTNLTVTRPSSN